MRRWARELYLRYWWARFRRKHPPNRDNDMRVDPFIDGVPRYFLADAIRENGHPALCAGCMAKCLPEPKTPRVIEAMLALATARKERARSVYA